TDAQARDLLEGGVLLKPPDQFRVLGVGLVEAVEGGEGQLAKSVVRLFAVKDLEDAAGYRRSRVGFDDEVGGVLWDRRREAFPRVFLRGLGHVVNDLDALASLLLQVCLLYADQQIGGGDYPQEGSNEQDRGCHTIATAPSPEYCRTAWRVGADRFTREK